MSRKLVLCFCEVRDDGLVTVHMLDGLPVAVIATVAAVVVRYVEAKGVTPEMLKEHVEALKCQGSTSGVDTRVTDFAFDPEVN